MTCRRHSRERVHGQTCAPEPVAQTSRRARVAATIPLTGEAAGRMTVGFNFRPVDREQAFLLPPSLRDWLPEDDLAWLVLDAVAEMDLGPIYARYRSDGWGAAAFDPAMMTALLLYAYATGERSSRRIEARCHRDIGYRV